MDRPVDPGLVARFRVDLGKVWPFVDSPDARLGLAVSGGPDSLALLLLANAALPARVEAATVDHGLRAESAAEAETVARLCADLEVAHRVLRVAIAPGNTQHSARTARYLALGEWAEERGLEGLATAHQLDDQAETLLMRLNRGSGVSGLAGIRARTGIPGHGGRLVRPALGWRRAELGAIVAAAGLEAASDPSNEDEVFDRVRIRKALRSADWLDVEGLARSAALLAEADDMVEIAIGREWGECVTPTGEGLRYDALRSGFGGVNLIRIGVVQAIARALGGEMDRGGAARVVESLIAGRPVNLGGIQGRVDRTSGRTAWQFGTENPRRT